MLWALWGALQFHAAACAPPRQSVAQGWFVGRPDRRLKTPNRQNAYAHVYSVLLCLLIIGPPDKKERKTKQNNQWHEVESNGPSPVHVSDL